MGTVPWLLHAQEEKVKTQKGKTVRRHKESTATKHNHKKPQHKPETGVRVTGWSIGGLNMAALKGLRSAEGSSMAV